jgi:hypothetical protein
VEGFFVSCERRGGKVVRVERRKVYGMKWISPTVTDAIELDTGDVEPCKRESVAVAVSLVDDTTVGCNTNVC